MPKYSKGTFDPVGFDLKTNRLRRNPHTARLWSPDELTSNKLDAILDVTSRNFQWDPETRAKGGRVIEILSEHTCQGMMQGYTLTGRTGLFPSYESFLGIVHTMMVRLFMANHFDNPYSPFTVGPIQQVFENGP